MNFLTKLIKTRVSTTRTRAQDNVYQTAGNRAPLYLAKNSRGGPVVFTEEGSLLTVGPPGTGKSRGVVVWNLQAYPGSLMVTDPKGELTRWTAQHRAEHLAQRIAVLDPFHISGVRSDSVNLLSSLVRAVSQEQGFRSEAERIGRLLLPDLTEIKDPYWRNGARTLIVSSALFLAAFRPDQCHLPGLHTVLWLNEHQFLESVLGAMRNSDALNGALRQYGENVIELVKNQKKQFGIFREEARTALAIFAPDEPCGLASRTGTIDLAELIDGNTTVYICLPPHMVASHGRWMGLITAQATHGIMAANSAGDCVFMLDEFPNLGPLPVVLEAVAQLRSKGLRVWAFIQDIAQLQNVYGVKGAEALLNQAQVLQVLGCQSDQLARYIEHRAGTFTNKAVNYNLPSPLDPTAVPTRSVHEIAASVLPAGRVLNLPAGQQILLRRNFPTMIGFTEIWRGPHL